MLSVENFYWGLNQNLLDPLEISTTYYYPWGTQNNLSAHEFRPLYRQRHCNHVLFYDQEPLWDSNLGKAYDDYQISLSVSKFLMILANSEWSDRKRQICKNNSMLDWYYFYHGFAALDWFRDAAYIDRDQNVDKAFISFNHVISHQRSYRISLLARLIHRDIVNRGTISWLVDYDKTVQEIENPSNFLSDHSRALCREIVTQCKTLPWNIDSVESNGTLSAHFGHHQLSLWQKALLHVVNETVFYDPKLHLTEKIFKPIVAKRPFILVAAPGNLAYLRRYGFKTFGRWIDESYDNILDPDQRLDAISNEVAKFSAMRTMELNQVLKDMQCVLSYNRQHFFGEFRRILVNELVDNFDQCIRIWNNGRLDGRELPLHPDLGAVKKLLMG